MNIIFPTWVEDAACASTDPEAFFPEVGESVAAVRRICASCTVTADCLNAAMEAEGSFSRHGRFGIFGGTSPSQRYAMYLRSQREQPTEVA